MDFFFCVCGESQFITLNNAFNGNSIKNCLPFFFWHGNFVKAFLVMHSLQRSKQNTDEICKSYRRQSFKNWLKFAFAIVLIRRETISMWWNFKLLSFFNHKKKTNCFAGDFIDNQLSFKFCVQIHGPLKNLWENAECLLLMKVQITR